MLAIGEQVPGIFVKASKVLVADSVNEYFAFGERLKMGFGVSQVHKGRERRGKGQGQVY